MNDWFPLPTIALNGVEGWAASKGVWHGPLDDEKASNDEDEPDD